MTITDIIDRLPPGAQVCLRDGVPAANDADLHELLVWGLLVRRVQGGAEVLITTDSGKAVRRELQRRAA